MSLELMNERLLQTIELENEAGFQVSLLNYGATIHSILVPMDGRDLNVVLSSPGLQDYLHDSFYLGATVGRYAVPNEVDIPTGELREVDGSRFDLRQAALLMDRIGGGGFGSEYGYDHTYELNGGREKLAFAAAAHSPDSGLWLKVHTTQPALQFYTGEYLDSPMQRRGGFCFEAQNFPDAPNQPAFPCAVLEPDNTYSQSILYEFGHADCAPI